MSKELLKLATLIAFGAMAISAPAPALAPPQALGPSGAPAGSGGAPLTNEAVIRMLQAISARIQSGPVNFDLSPAGLAALRQAGVSEAMLNEMIQRERQSQASGGGTGSPQPAGAVPGKVNGGTPTPQPGKGTIAVKARTTPPSLSPVVTNPAAMQSTSALIGLLRQQKQTALSKGGQNTSPGGSTPNPNYTRASAARTALPVSTPPPPSSSSALGIRTAPGARGNLNVACGTFNSPIIQTVSGQSAGMAVFSQDPAYNPFIIEGCNFGNTPGHAQLNFPDGRKLANLKVYSWSDNAITVEVDPSLLDVLDQNNISLVLTPATGQQAQRSGFKFYAMRREFLLNKIPVGQVYLAPTKDASGNLVAPHFSSPVSGASAEVQRGNVVRFGGGTDQYNFEKLKPGFVMEKYQVSEASNNIGCEGVGLAVPNETDYTDGTWSWETSGNAIRISWQEKHVHCTGPWGDSADGSLASYGLHVWLVGPALSSGASPWQ